MAIENLKELFQLVDDNKLVLPDFQRNYVWKKNDQKALAASLLLSLPIGSFLILSGKKDDFATKELGFGTRVANPKDECMFLLDGQQRLTSLKLIFSDMYNTTDWKQTLEDIYSQLKVRWFMRIIPDSSEEDIFGWENLKFDKEKLMNCEPSSVEERLVEKTIGKTLNRNWWNPNYKPVDSQGNCIDNNKSNRAYMYLAKKMYDEKGLLPLYVIGSNDSRILLQYAIKEIAERRKDELIAKYSSDWDKTIEILNDVEPLIEEYKEEVIEIEKAWNQLSLTWQTNLMNYLVNILEEVKLESIVLPADKISRAVVIFERINKGGTSLDNFDLVVARAARDNTHGSLTKRIIHYLDKEISLPNSINKGILFDKPIKLKASNYGAVIETEIHSIIKKQYLNLLSIISYTDYGDVDKIKIDFTKKDKILNLTHEQINNQTERVILALARACIFLVVRCGISNLSELHFNLMILPIAYLMLNDDVWNSSAQIDKMEYWYWGSMFTDEYRYNQNVKSITDIQELYKWIIKDIEVERIKKFSARILNVPEYITKDILIRKDKSEVPISVKKGILQYVLSKQPKDILFDQALNAWEMSRGLTKEFTFDSKIENVELTLEDHHIIPLKSATSIQESTKELRDNQEHILNSILNRTLILKNSNRLIGDKSPSNYLSRITEVNGFTSSQGHFIDEGFKNEITNSLDDENTWYELLGKRYDAIKNVLFQELHSLYNSVD